MVCILAVCNWPQFWPLKTKEWITWKKHTYSGAIILPDKAHQNISHLTWTVICLEHQNTSKALLLSALIKHLCLVLRLFKTLALTFNTRKNIFLIFYFIWSNWHLNNKKTENSLSFLLFPYKSSTNGIYTSNPLQNALLQHFPFKLVSNKHLIV